MTHSYVEASFIHVSWYDMTHETHWDVEIVSACMYVYIRRAWAFVCLWAVCLCVCCYTYTQCATGSSMYEYNVGDCLFVECIYGNCERLYVCVYIESASVCLSMCVCLCVCCYTYTQCATGSSMYEYTMWVKACLLSVRIEIVSVCMYVCILRAWAFVCMCVFVCMHMCILTALVFVRVFFVYMLLYIHTV